MAKAKKSEVKESKATKATKAKPAAKVKAAPKAKATAKEGPRRKCSVCLKYNTGHNARTCQG